MRIPGALLMPTVRRGRDLGEGAITRATVAKWRRNDAPNFLLRLGSDSSLPAAVRRHLASEAGQKARLRYKCRVREPWYSVPQVRKPDLFLSYLSSDTPRLVENRAGCACTNAVHAVHLRGGQLLRDHPTPAGLQRRWNTSLTALSCEIEGHPLGGGVLKLEPREALRVLVADRRQEEEAERTLLQEGIALLQAWRHRG